jgi:hypothetical protein
MAREVAGILSADIEREASHLGVAKVLAANNPVARNIAGGHTSGSWADLCSLRSPT